MVSLYSEKQGKWPDLLLVYVQCRSRYFKEMFFNESASVHRDYRGLVRLFEEIVFMTHFQSSVSIFNTCGGKAAITIDLF